MKCPRCRVEFDEHRFYFCPNCGAPKDSDKKTINAGKFILYFIILLLWVGILAIVFICSNEDFFFDTDTGNNPDGTVYTPIPTSENKNAVTDAKSALSTTKIVHNRQYYKQTFRNEDDVYNLIVSDSTSQKSSCPSEIVTIENDIINSYNIKAVNLCEMDVSFAKELRNVVNYIYNNYPQARGYLTNLTLANVGDDADYMAAFMPIFTFAHSNSRNGYPTGVKTQILLNAKYFLNISKIEKSVSYSTQVGYFPKNATRSSTVAHEFGHYLGYVALLNYYEQSRLNFVRTTDANMLYTVSEDFNNGYFSYKIINQAYKKYKTVYNSDISFNQFREMISNYAVAKDSNGNYIYDETIAEAFHDCYLNKSDANIASQLIMEVLLSYL